MKNYSGISGKNGNAKSDSSGYGREYRSDGRADPFIQETFTTTPRPGIQLSDNLKKERFENALRVLGNALEDEKTPVQRVLYEDHNLIIAIE